MHSARLVIGYGNPLRGDDGLGWVVAERLRTELGKDRHGADVVVLTEHQLTPELAEPISRARLVIFVDARAGDQPGRVDCRPVVASGAWTQAFSHDVDPSSLLQMTRLLYGACPTALSITADGDDFGYGASLSPAVRWAVPVVVRRIHEILVDGMATIQASVAAGTDGQPTGG